MHECNFKDPLSDQQCEEMINAVGDALYVIGGKWKLRIIIALSNGRKRFNELQKALNGISARVLSNDLKDLELNGFVRRIERSESSTLLVEYELLEYSHTLLNVISSLNEWGTMHKKKIMHKD
ncbi:winged helix-turn-helix transcriptional regulator [Chitinophaga pinensis]|uniref:Transcriptional regulator, HxlR family n=1 Tax=Chitinophaga pinensis (strain ATCC 43595 / DSM 2588 / LMG 13176 / NBRC 15968 / NCIMB 11800 / UQM 2034) TaxID=485918 RepID=A0A979G4E8_CHIPD|nr:helix-turn-helix domain-containing protein [Chitinophaga pinensis]ACU60594.1 transcriptional regulator, HxlR family [Chitinophaga pinensis DSM 2588]